MNAAEGARSQIGSVLGGRYVLLRVIGTGGMGAVFEAEHTVTKRRVALKLIHRELLERASVAERFLREARATAALRHPAIVDVLDAGQDPDGRLFLAFELLDGITLGQALKDKRIAPIDTVRVAIGVLAGLEVLHANRLVHRDVKPENVFLLNGSADRVKLLDFGVAKDVADARKRELTKPGAIVGTARYMSPEQAASAPIDGRADIWAVGATLYAAFAGRAALAARPIPPLSAVCSAISEQLASVIDRALAIDPNDRWQTASEMREALSAIDLGAEASIDPPPSIPEPTELSPTLPAPGRSKRLLTVGAIAWIAAILTVILLLLGRQEREAPVITVMEKGPEVSLPEPPPPAEPPPPPSAETKTVRKKVKRKQAEKKPAEKEPADESPWSQPKRQL